MLQDAKRTICLASMTLSGYICAALRDAAQRGVVVRIIVNELSKAISADKLNGDNIFFKVYRHSPACRLALHGHKDHGQSLFHQKFLLVDVKFLSYGSCNSSEACFKNHHENLLFTNDQRFLQPFRQEFWTRWKEFGS
ncbi:hypothetical protein RvY_14019 [Ramazzottius varieornatus]|uniref:Mitochondrial cardiolipin hydrolase n=1 Tax=Ramazzottius varieornatus TaxID=947166 RepID=A0A1D1VTT0_RAMVA|nr:hypothetical protein RvY_14019 [Ramazzottius varieornatus]